MTLKLTLLTACLLASAPLFASSGIEEVSQAPHGNKRLAAGLAQGDEGAHKKSKTRAALQEAPEHASLPIWTSGLSFENTPEGRAQHHTFVNSVMPQVMTAMLVMYKRQEPNAVFSFLDVLEAHQDFSSMGVLLKETRLWTFLRGIKDAQPSNLPLAAFSVGEHVGDGDKMFANMLHYIKGDFRTSPVFLPFYEAPKEERFTSPQMRMHKAQLLKDQFAHARSDIKRAQLWDEILETFDDLSYQELCAAGRDYSLLALKYTDSATQFKLHHKGAQLFERAWDAQSTTMSLRGAALAYLRACESATKETDKVLCASKSVAFWDRYLAQETAPEAFELECAALAYKNLFHQSSDTEKDINILLKSAELYDRFFKESKAPLHPYKCNQVAGVYAMAAACKFDAAYATKADELWDIFFAHNKTPPADLQNSIADFYVVMAAAVSDPRTKERYLQKSARLKNVSELNPTEATPAQGH